VGANEKVECSSTNECQVKANWAGHFHGFVRVSPMSTLPKITWTW